MIYWSVPKKDEYTEELRVPLSDNEQNWRNVDGGKGIFFLQKTEAKAGTLKNNDGDSDLKRTPFQWSLIKRTEWKAIERSHTMKKGWILCKCWLRQKSEKSHNFGNCRTTCVAKGFSFFLFSFHFFLFVTPGKWITWQKQSIINSFKTGYFHRYSNKETLIFWYVFCWSACVFSSSIVHVFRYRHVSWTHFILNTCRL